MSSACPSFTFTCSNISCSIWFCCGGGGSNKEAEQYPPEQYPPEQYLKSTSEKHQQPPDLPPASPPAAVPPPQATVHARSPQPPQTNRPHHVPSTKTYYPQPPSTPQQPQTLLPPTLPPSIPAPPSKVHNPWPLSSSQIIIPPDVQYTRMHKPPPQPAPVASQPPPLQTPWPASNQPCKAHQALSSSEKPHMVPPHLPSNTYQQAAAPGMASPESLPPRPLVDSTPFMGYYPQEHPEFFVQGSYLTTR